jgi:hypothetical protein
MHPGPGESSSCRTAWRVKYREWKEWSSTSTLMFFLASICRRWADECLSFGASELRLVVPGCAAARMQAMDLVFYLQIKMLVGVGVGWQSHCMGFVNRLFCPSKCSLAGPSLSPPSSWSLHLWSCLWRELSSSSVVGLLSCIPGQPGLTPHGSEYQPRFSSFYKKYRQGLVLAGLVFLNIFSKTLNVILYTEFAETYTYFQSTRRYESNYVIGFSVRLMGKKNSQTLVN